MKESDLNYLERNVFNALVRATCNQRDGGSDDDLQRDVDLIEAYAASHPKTFPKLLTLFLNTTLPRPTPQ